GVAVRVEREERRMKEDPKQRSSKRTLESLVTHNLLYEVPGTPSGEWDRFHIRNIGLAVNRRMAREFGGDAGKVRAVCEPRAAAELGLKLRGLSATERALFSAVAPAIAQIPDLRRWARSERDAVADVVRAKAGRSERRYLALLQQHPRLRRALIRLGSV